MPGGDGTGPYGAFINCTDPRTGLTRPLYRYRSGGYTPYSPPYAPPHAAPYTPAAVPQSYPYYGYNAPMQWNRAPYPRYGYGPGYGLGFGRGYYGYGRGYGPGYGPGYGFGMRRGRGFRGRGRGW